MSSSGNYPVKENPTLADQAMIWDTTNMSWKRSPFSSVQNLFEENATNILYEEDSQYETVLTGFSVDVNVNDNDTHLLLNAAGTLATGTIVLPAAVNLRDKQTLLVTSNQEVTALTIDGNGITVNGAPTTIAQYGYFKLKYDLTLGVWNRVG